MNDPRRKLAAVVVSLLLVLGVYFLGADRSPAAARSGRELQGEIAVRHDGDSLRVATFNLHSGKTKEGEPALELAARTLEGFDLVGLQEVRGVFTGLGKGQAERLGNALELGWLFAPSERRYWHDHFGNAVLSNAPVKRWHSVPLASTRGKAYRNAVLLETRLGGRTVNVVVTHLDTQDDREAQLREVRDLFLGLSEPAVLLGDLNTRADDPLLVAMLSTPGLVDAHADKALPADRVDWILVRGLAVEDAGVVDLGASDHPCLWAELLLP